MGFVSRIHKSVLGRVGFMGFVRGGDQGFRGFVRGGDHPCLQPRDLRAVGEKGEG